MLSYETIKYVSIQDSRLGCLRYLLLALIVVYVGVFEMWAKGGYLESSSVVGVVRFSLQQPTENSCDPSEDDCANAFAPLNTLPYCEQSTVNASYRGNVYPCAIYEAINAQMVSERSLTVITRASTVNQTLACSSSDLECPRVYKNLDQEYKFYTAQSEAFTVLLDHAVAASKICTYRPGSYACSAESAVYQGRLRSKDEELCRREHQLKNNSYAHYRGTKRVNGAPCYVEPNRTAKNLDFFSLDVLLRAAGVSLDDCVNATSSHSSMDNSDSDMCATYRDLGATLLLNVFWADFDLFHGKVEPYYYYSPQLVGSSYKQTVPYYQSYRGRRTLLNAHGIKLAVLLSGEFHEFEIVSFLITLTTAFGLFAIATTVVDSLMLYVLPEKNRYKEAKYESTEELFDGASFVQILHRGLGNGILRRRHGEISGVPEVTANRPTSGDSGHSTLETYHDALDQPLLEIEHGS